MYKKFTLYVGIFLLFTLLIPPAHAQLPQISSGLNYLTSSQNPDGTWGNAASVNETTAVTVAGIDTLKLLNQTAGSAYSNATTWLQGQTPNAVCYISERIRALSITDNSISAVLPATDPATGALGGDEGYVTNNLDTALALQALKSSNYPDLSINNNALAYLTNTQNTDGGWGFSSGDDSSIYITAIVSATLRQFPQTASIANAITKASAWLVAHQNADGGFGVTASGVAASTVYETALAYVALVGDGQTQGLPLQRALDYLTATQSLNGSWNDDAYSTALAIKALYLSENIPAPSPPALTTGGVMGYVVDGTTNTPLIGVTATLASNSAITATSNASGMFVLPGIANGSQQITLTLTGYAPLTISAILNAGDFINVGKISLAAAAPATGIVQGVVWDVDMNAPFSGVTVRVVSGGSTYETISGPDGSYRLANIPSGTVTMSTPAGPANKPAYWNISRIDYLAPGGMLIFNPRMVQTQHAPPYASVYLRTDKSLYKNGDPVALTVNIQNNRSTSYAATLKLHVTDPTGASVYDTSIAVNLTANTMLTQNLNFTLPITAKAGSYTAQAELYDGNNALLGTAPASFTVQTIPVLITPRIPALLNQGDNIITFDLANNSNISISAGSLAITLKNPDGQTITSSSQPFTLAQGESKTLSYTLTFPALKFGTYTLSYVQSDETALDQTGTIPLANSIDLTAHYDKYSYKAGDTANLLISLNNTGKFNLTDVSMNVSLPDAGYTDTRTLTIGSGTQTQQNTIPLPGTVPTGELTTTITLTLPGGAATNKIVPCLVAQPILEVTPANGSTNVPVRTPILVHFSENVNPSSITAGMVSLSANGVPVPGSISLTADGSSLIYTPQDKLTYATTYTFTMKADAQAMAGKSTVIDLTSTFSTPTYDPDLVGYWPMDGDWKDYSGSGNNAEAFGSSTFSDGKNSGVSAATFVNDSKYFPGSGGYVPATTQYIASAPNTFTISFWAKPDATRNSTAEATSGISGIGGQRYAIAPFIPDVDGAGAGVSVGTNGVSVFEHNGMDDFTSYLSSPLVYDTPTQLSDWTHVVVVYNNKQPSLYVDGQLVKTGQTSQQSVVYPSALFADYVNGSGGTPTSYGAYSGQMEEVAVYKRALTTDEIQTLYQSTSRKTPSITITSSGQTNQYKPGDTGSATITANSTSGITKLYCSATGVANGDGLALYYEIPQAETAQQLSFQVEPNASPNATIRIACVAQSSEGAVGTGQIELTVADTVPPSVSSTTPGNNAIDVSATMPIAVTFIESMDKTSFKSRDTFKFQRADNGAFVTGVSGFSTDGKTLILVPSPALDAGTTYTLTISGVRDLAGNPLANDYVLRFTILQQISLTVDGQGTASSPYVLPSGRYGTLTLNNSNVSISGGVTADSVTITNSSVNVSPTSTVPGNLSTAYGDMVATGSNLTVNGSMNLAANMNLTNSTMNITDTSSVAGNVFMDNSTLTLKKAMQVIGNITLQNNSLLTHFAATTTDTSKLDITAANMSIDLTSKIDVSGKGYLGGYQRGDNPLSYRYYTDCYGQSYVPAAGENSVATGRTNGNTTSGGSSTGSGGSYGGMGGSSSGSSNSGYGDTANPNDLGSGGGGYYNLNFTGICYVDWYYSGGNGGGLIRLNAASLDIEGSIVANGGNSEYGAGSGGGIRIDASSIQGSGTITAKGGDSTGAGGGGGGRIAIFSSSTLLPIANIQANGGTGNRDGGAGTVYLSPNLPQVAANITPVSGTTNVPLDTVVTVTSIDSASVIPGLVSLTVQGVSVPGSIYFLSDKTTMVFKPDLILSSAQAYVFTIKAGVRNVTGHVFTSDQIAAFSTPSKASVVVENLGTISSPYLLASGSYQTLMIINSFVELDGPVIAENVTISSNATVSHKPTGLTGKEFLDLTVTGTLSVEAGSKIDVTGKGYLGAWRGANNDPYGRTQGNTIVGGSDYDSGGSYGGLGGSTYYNHVVNIVYGDPSNPDDVGSGGSTLFSWVPAGSGGGLVRINAGVLSLDGKIIADGETVNNSAGAGSGGGIHIDVSTLSGTGYIFARGGNVSGSGGGGGGGRIALYYGTLAFPIANVDVKGGSGTVSGGDGTLYLLPKNDTTPPSIVSITPITGGVDIPLEATVVVHFNDIINPASVTGGMISLTSNGVTIPGAVTFSSDKTSLTFKPTNLLGSGMQYRFTMKAGIADYAGNSIANDEVVTFTTIKKSMTIENVGSASSPYVLSSGYYNNLSLKDSYVIIDGAVTADTFSITSNTTVTQKATGLTGMEYLDLTVLGELTIDFSSKVDVSGKGYLGGYSGNNNFSTGRTVGNTTSGGSENGSGGSYGGLGGSYYGNAVNALYGISSNPNEVGSGGSTDNTAVSGNGGGLAIIKAGSLSLEGSILADGGDGAPNGGGGSGGGIRINAGAISGNGYIYARGGLAGGYAQYRRGGGGGGRIAIYYDSMKLPETNIAVDGGSGYVDGSPGTIFISPNTMTATISLAGTGAGTIVSTPAGISCGATCTNQFATFSTVTLSASATTDSTFTGWSGACNGTGTCTVTMDAAKNVTATFALIPPPTVTILSPTGTIKNNKPLLQYTVSTGTVVVKVDGAVVNKVSGDYLDTLSDGTHLVRVEAADSFGRTGFDEKTVTIDTIPPSLTVNPVPTPIRITSLTLAGTVETGAGLNISTTTGATVGPVNFTHGTWSCVITNLTAGLNMFTVTAADQAGNTTSLDVSTTYVPPLAISIASPSITADHQGTLGITISNLTPAGSETLIEQFVDTNRNGTVDAGDYAIRSFKVSDGITSGNLNVQGDEDALANGIVTTSLNYLLANDLYHASGRYNFKVTRDTETATIPFVVEPVTQPQTVSGNVTDGTNPIPGAIIRLLDKWQRPVAWTIADETGAYVLNVKQPGEYIIIPVVYGYVAPATSLTIAAGEYIDRQNLTVTAGTYHAAGKVMDAASSTGIGGVWVQAKGNDNTAIVITGADGNYDLALPYGQYAISALTDTSIPGASAKGYTGFNNHPLNINANGNVAGMDIGLQIGDISVTGRVLDPTGNPVPGLPVQGRIRGAIDVREPISFGVSDAAGNYSLGLFAGTNWDIFIDNTTAQALGYLGTIHHDLSTAIGPLTGNDLTVHPITAWIKGTVKDSTNKLLPGIEIQLRNADSSITASVITAQDGSYRMGTFAGTWFVDALTTAKGLPAVPEQSVTLVDSQISTNDFIVDVTPPTVIITSPAAGITNNPRPKLAYTVSDGAVVVKVDDMIVSKQSGDSLDQLANGQHTVRVEATDTSGNPGYAEVTFTVNYTPPLITTTTLPFGITDSPYNQLLMASGGLTLFTWSITAGNLPAGLSLNPSSGDISGTPTTTGTSNFTVQVIDSDNTTATATLSIAVYSPLSVTTVSLPAGNVASSYSQTVAATGGKTPYSWSISSGSLPAGLTLTASTGVISGTPTTIGTTSFTVKVTDTNNVTTTKSLSITINAALPDLVVTAASAPATGTRGKTISVSATVKNQGQVSAAGSTLTFYLSTDAAITTTDTSLGDMTANALSAGTSQVVSGNLKIPTSIAAGTYYVGAIADRTAAVTESNETNNSLAGNTIVVK